jgi:hypothetical protein
MRTRAVTVREGDEVGPIDWEHETAKDKPPIWREAEADPHGFLYNGREIVRLCMYDGWPYWTPKPAIQFIGPLHTAQWDFFNSYGCYDNSITRKAPLGERCPQEFER